MSDAAAHPPTALVVGASGVAGSTLAEHLVHEDWTVLALSRRTLKTQHSRVTYIQADLRDKDNLITQLAPHHISHVFYAAHKREGLLTANKAINVRRLRQQIIFAGHFLPVLRWIPGAMTAYYRFAAKEAGALDKNKTNLSMFQNLMEALEATNHPLQHVSVITGAKYYGMHLGEELYPDYSIPFDEDKTPRVPGPNWYYDVEDYLINNQSNFNWSVFRPSFIIGIAVDAPFNFGTALAVYCVLQKIKGEPMVFWGDEEARRCSWEISPAQQLAKMMVWSATEPKAANQAFNCTTGESFTWAELWPRLAERLGMPFEFQDHGFSMKRYLDENRPLWSEVVQRYQLKQHTLDELISWEFIDKSMAINWDVAFDMRKATQMGFKDFDKVDNVFMQLFEKLAHVGMIPNWKEL